MVVYIESKLVLHFYFRHHSIFNTRGQLVLVLGQSLFMFQNDNNPDRWIAEAVQQLHCPELIGSSTFIVPANVTQHILSHYRCNTGMLQWKVIYVYYLSCLFQCMSVEVTSKYSQQQEDSRPAADVKLSLTLQQKSTLRFVALVALSITFNTKLFTLLES